jgi:hypothetical protein
VLGDWPGWLFACYIRKERTSYERPPGSIGEKVQDNLGIDGI